MPHMKPTADKPTTRQISIFEAAARARFDPGIARGVQWGIWEAAWIAANSEESTGPDGHPFYRLPESYSRDYWQARWAAPFALDAEKLAHEKTLDELKAEQAVLESERARNAQLLAKNREAQDIRCQLDLIENTVSKIKRQQLTRAHYDRLNPVESEPRAKGAGAKRKFDLDGRQTAAVLDLAKKHGRTVPTNADAAAIIRRGKCDFKEPYTKPASLLTAARRQAERTSKA